MEKRAFETVVNYFLAVAIGLVLGYTWAYYHYMVLS